MDSGRATTYTAITLVIVGLVLVFLAWNGAAELDRTPEQIPYLISGGLAGVILAGCGLVLLRIYEARRDASMLGGKLDRLHDSLDRLHVELAEALAAPTPQAADETTVIAGRSVYHLPSCHLVGERKGAQTLSVTRAQQRGLGPCRICRPQGAEAPTANGAAAAAAPTVQVDDDAWKPPART